MEKAGREEKEDGRGGRWGGMRSGGSRRKVGRERKEGRDRRQVEKRRKMGRGRTQTGSGVGGRLDGVAATVGMSHCI